MGWSSAGGSENRGECFGAEEEEEEGGEEEEEGASRALDSDAGRAPSSSGAEDIVGSAVFSFFL
jgi:hypothetical protein